MGQSTPRPETQIVCAILAAQAAGLRSEIVAAAGVEIEFLYQMSDIVTQATEIVRDAAHHRNGLPPHLAERCLEVAAAEPGSAVDAFAFAQAQRLDLVSQMADFLVSALTRLAENTDGLNAAELAKLYVSENQRKIHDETLPRTEGESER